jgi:hypothetical protein
VPAELTDGWLIDGSLIYRLNAEGVNCDEINVTMANGSRAKNVCHDAAVELLAELRADSSEVRLSAVREGTLTVDALAAAFKRAGLDIQWVGKDVRKPMTCGSIELAELLKVFNELRVDGAAVREARNEAQWISVSERLPEIPADVPSYSTYVRVLAVGASGWVSEMRYAVNSYAKTEKGRAPRWEESDGRLAFNQPTHWMPLPASPAASKEGDSHE